MSILLKILFRAQTQSAISQLLSDQNKHCSSHNIFNSHFLSGEKRSFDFHSQSGELHDGSSLLLAQPPVSQN